MIEVGDGGVEVGVGALVPGVASLNVELIGVGVLRALVGNLLFFSAAEFGAQLVGNVAGDLLLQRNDVGGFAFVLAAPDFGIVFDVGKVGGNLDGVSALRDAAGEEGVDGEVLADLLRIDIFGLVTEDGVTGFYFQVWGRE